MNRNYLKYFFLAVASLAVLGLFVGLYLRQGSIFEISMTYTVVALVVTLIASIFMLLVHTMIYDKNPVVKTICAVLIVFITLFIIANALQIIFPIKER